MQLLAKAVLWLHVTLYRLTNGCIGVSNIAMDIIWSAVDDKVPIEIRP